MKKIVFILGCQRSGTTATINGLGENKNIYVFKEVNDIIHKKTIEKNNIRLRSQKNLNSIFKSIAETHIILKPLVESQNVIELLNDFPESVGFWLIRDYKSVARSMMKKWGRKIGIDFLAKSTTMGTWQNEKIDDLLPLIINLKTKDLSEWDFACIFWYIRNFHYYKQSLHTNNRILLLHYNYLLNDSNYLQNRFDKLNLNLLINSDFYEKRPAIAFDNIELNPLIKQLCSDMWNRLNSDHNKSV